ncbi:MAG: hypothetical protein H6759_05515 [Candidatus Nomurabacteria bacterium]|nr:MAG: hypothetical protein H6759_05515 [Candidatus Nomurabacteria bacterium]
MAFGLAWAPLGYINDKNARCIAVDKEKAKYIKRAFEMYATGEYPLAQIRKIINSLRLETRKAKCFPSQIISTCSKTRFIMA